MKKKRIFSALAALLMCLSLPVFASASEMVEPRFTNGLKWPPTITNVKFQCVGTFSSSQKTAIRAAMNKWNAVKAPDGDSLRTLSLTTSESANKIKWYNSGIDGWQGKMVEVPGMGGIFESATILLADNVSWSTTGASNAYDMQTIVEHELGHALGVAHCHENPQRSDCYSSTCSKNVMNPTSARGRVRTTLQEYDKASYILIYWDEEE
ncbi:MAG: matrixin family metalloprotease [Oscillospiraceae bacterium]|jgi:hypothetical protein|nr:matrixin family metalloprotease [Oscillospiraceae bacterium]